VQVDVWSKGNYTDLVNAVHEKMLAAGFIKQNFYDLYEDDLKIYHKAMRFFKEVL
jgi:NADPH-dependent glutamate synthase beta subunit-like oxidoreductase